MNAIELYILDNIHNRAMRLISIPSYVPTLPTTSDLNDEGTRIAPGYGCEFLYAAFTHNYRFRNVCKNI